MAQVKPFFESYSSKGIDQALVREATKRPLNMMLPSPWFNVVRTTKLRTSLSFIILWTSVTACNKNFTHRKV